MSAVLLLGAVVGSPAPAAAQSSADSGYVLRAVANQSMRFREPALKDMLQRTRRLEEILEQDPRVLYYIGTGPAASDSMPGPAYPWNVVRVRNDSVAEVAVPRNYREARRGYYNYAVRKMRLVREAPPASGCDTSVERETDLVSVFLDGWIVTRTLYGGPALAPLDAMVFAREAGHLPAMLVALRDAEIRGCVDRWSEQNADAMEAYRSWSERFWGAPGAPEPPPPDTTPVVPDSVGPAPAPPPADPDNTGESAPDGSGTPIP